MSNATLDDILKELREIKELLKKIANDTYRIP
jgi:RNA polymerase-binding transcription factor DksA